MNMSKHIFIRTSETTSSYQNNRKNVIDDDVTNVGAINLFVENLSDVVVAGADAIQGDVLEVFNHPPIYLK